jgi:hypothetical protein
VCADALFLQVTRAYTADDSGSFVPIVAFDCRGCEPTAWYPDQARAADDATWQGALC